MLQQHLEVGITILFNRKKNETEHVYVSAKVIFIKDEARLQTYFFLTHAFLLDLVVFYRNYLGHSINHCKIQYLVFFRTMY